VLPIVGALASAGLNLLAEVVKEKGKNFVEQKFGVKIPDDPKELNQETLIKLKELELKHEEELQRLLLEEKKAELAYKTEVDKETTKRWLSDNTAGLITKLTRPLTLIFLLVSFVALAVLDQTLLSVKDIYIKTLAELLQMAVLAYFGLRSFEKLKGVEK